MIGRSLLVRILRRAAETDLDLRHFTHRVDPTSHEPTATAPEVPAAPADGSAHVPRPRRLAR